MAGTLLSLHSRVSMAVASPLSRKTVSVDLPITIKMQQDSEETEEPWFRNPWVWLIIAIPALTVVAGLLTLYLAITNPAHHS